MFSSKKIQEKFLEAPEDVQEAITSSKVNERLLDLADKYKLQFDEADELTKEMGFLMLGLKPKDNFVKNIEKVTGLEQEKAKELAQEINETIFKDIRDSLRKMHSQDEEDEENLDEEQVRAEIFKEIENTKNDKNILKEKPEEAEEEIAAADSLTENLSRNDGRKATAPSSVSASSSALGGSGNEAVSSSSLLHPSAEEEGEELSGTQQSEENEKEAPAEAQQPKEEAMPTKKERGYTQDPYREPLD